MVGKAASHVAGLAPTEPKTFKHNGVQNSSPKAEGVGCTETQTRPRAVYGKKTTETQPLYGESKEEHPARRNRPRRS